MSAGSAMSASKVAESDLQPLAGTYQLLLQACESLRVELVPPSLMEWAGSAKNWVDGAALADRPELLDALIEGESARIADEFGQKPRTDVVPSRLLHHYVWSVALLMSGPWYLARRVPRIRPGDIRIQLATADLAFGPRGFACLPDDPAAGQPGVKVLAHEEALRAELRSAVADHMRPLLAAAGPRMRRGPRAQWGMVGDDLVSGIWYLGRMLDQEEQSVRAAAALLPGPIAPFPAGADFRRLQGRAGRTHLTRTRAGCCLYYAIRPAVGSGLPAPQACLTCPRTCDEERVRRLEEE
ncbi:iron-sulfur protein [Streptomyces indicus]|uniref:FhuF 2Fe-2S C-terminal domain-containing protein n=1 Tax=Streptomyces indicus TaxID=417292 RepID=A0A1G9A463_9ACTN|nr:hypothetical protein SAMN05421806_105354 [Streptomyces indicus]